MYVSFCTHDASILHIAEHPSPSSRLPSSHCSGNCKTPLPQTGGSAVCPPIPQLPNGISNANARLLSVELSQASTDHITCLPEALNVIVSHSRSSSLNAGSLDCAVEKLKTTILVADLLTTLTWLHPLKPSYKRSPPMAKPNAPQALPGALGKLVIRLPFT